MTQFDKTPPVGKLFLNISEKTGKKYVTGEVNGMKVIGSILKTVAKSGKNQGQEITYILLNESTAREDAVPVKKIVELDNPF